MNILFICLISLSLLKSSRLNVSLLKPGESCSLIVTAFKLIWVSYMTYAVGLPNVKLIFCSRHFFSKLDFPEDCLPIKINCLSLDYFWAGQPKGYALSYLINWEKSWILDFRKNWGSVSLLNCFCFYYNFC